MTREEYDQLEEGTVVVVTWGGGNGPHKYTISVSKWGDRSIKLGSLTIGYYEDVRSIEVATNDGG